MEYQPGTIKRCKHCRTSIKLYTDDGWFDDLWSKDGTYQGWTHCYKGNTPNKQVHEHDEAYEVKKTLERYGA